MFDYVLELLRVLTPIIGAICAMWAVKLGRTIHTLVNSNLTKVQTDLAVALARIEKLEAHIVNYEQSHHAKS